MKCEESLCPALVSFKTELWEYEWKKRKRKQAGTSKNCRMNSKGVYAKRRRKREKEAEEILTNG